MAKKLSMIVGLMLTLVFGYVAISGEAPNLDGITCPISGKAVVAEGTAQHNGGTVYFCCENCPNAFAKNTAKFAAKANYQLVLTKQAKQVKCPLTGRPVNEEHMVTVAKVEVGLCCPNCKAKVSQAEGDAQLELVFNDKVFAKGFEVPKKGE